MNTRAKSKSQEPLLSRDNNKGNKNIREKDFNKIKIKINSNSNSNDSHKSRVKNSRKNKENYKQNKQTKISQEKEKTKIQKFEIHSSSLKNNINIPSSTSSSSNIDLSLSISSDNSLGVQTRNRNQNRRLNQYAVFNDYGKRTRENLKEMQLNNIENIVNEDEDENEHDSDYKSITNSDLNETEVEEEKNISKILKNEKNEKNTKNSKNQKNTKNSKNKENNPTSIQTRKKKKLGGEESYLTNRSSILKNSSLFLKQKKCSICLDLILNPATISNCKHEFCLPCLRSWVSKASTCPMCRESFQTYTYIQNNKEISIQILEKDFSDYSISDESFLYSTAESCMICKNSNNENLLLICDGCSFNVCHTYCTNMDRIPDGDWLCAECVVIKYSKNIRPGQREKLLKVLNEDSDEERE
jgi:hypothetical protein